MSYKKDTFYQVFTIIFGLLVLSISGAFLVNILYYLVLANFDFKTPMAEMLKPQGKFVEVDGNQMHINCTGEGDDTVVLEADQGQWSIYWGAVQKEVSKFAKVCSYDRLGKGWSGGQVQNYNDDIRTLNKLLKTAGLEGPFIMAGHKWGAENVVRYYKAYPEDVKGLILYDYNWQKEEALMNAYKNDQMNIPLIAISTVIDEIPEAEKKKMDEVRIKLYYHLDEWQKDSIYILLDEEEKYIASQAVAEAVQLFDNL